MSTPLFRNYIWLVDTIYRAGSITMEEINRKWLGSELSDGKKIPLRTFHNWRAKVEETFDINIACRKSANEYYIENAEELSGNNLRAWLLNTFTVSNVLQNSAKIKDRVSLENIPSGMQFLTLILESMQENAVLKITYQSYHTAKPATFSLSPYFLKLFKQRWYVIGTSEIKEPRIYALDRIKSVEKTEKKFKKPANLDAETYFTHCYGIINDSEIKPSKITLKISAGQANYARDLPLHHSQKEIETKEEYSVFEYYLKATYDFIQEILKHSAQIEVLTPDSLRQEIKNKLIEAMNQYSSAP